MYRLNKIKKGCALTLFSLLVTLGCNDEAFKGKSSVGAGSRNITSACAPNALASQTQQQVEGLASTEIQVEGEFCTISLDPVQEPALTVLFVVDFSSSMAGPDRGDGLTCERLKAADTVLKKIVPPGTVDRNGNPPPVNVGVVSFGTSSREQIPVGPIDNFATLNFGDFCGSRDGSTNYEAAFTTATNVLRSSAGSKKVVYFISDGLPTTSQSSGFGGSDEDARQMGIEAAAPLRNDPDVTINVLYLQQQITDPDATDPATYLQSVAGPPKNGTPNVIIIQDASQLASNIQLLDYPPPTQIETSGITASLFADGFDARKVKVNVTNGSGEGRYRYVTDKFQLFGRPNQPVVNTLTVTAAATDGTRPESVTTITFTQTTNVD